MKINQLGRSMVEMLGVLAIIGVLSAGALAGYSKAMFQHKMNKTIEEATKIFQRFEELVHKDWGGTEENTINIYGTESYVQYGLLEKCNKISRDRCKLPIGAVWMDLYQDSQTYGGIIFNFTDSKSCVAFLSVPWEQMLPQEWWSPRGYIDVGGYWINDFLNDPTEARMTKITEACEICDDDDECAIWFVYRDY